MKKESEKDHQTSSKGVGRRPPITVVESSAEEEEEEEVVTASVEQPSQQLLSSYSRLEILFKYISELILAL